MNSLKDMKLLRGLVRSQERKKYYSTNTSKILNTYKCPEHNEYFTKICLKCNLDICLRCEKNYHSNHQAINYEEINPDYNEIENLQKKVNIYIDKYNNIKKEIYAWYNELKNKIFDFELSIKNNEIINSADFILNYQKNKISLNSILKFRKIYYNIMDDYNIKNTKIISIINQYGNNKNINLPLYYDFFEIKDLLQKLNQNGINYNKDNFIKKGELILNYLLKIPYIENIENNNDFLSKSNSFYNIVKNPFLSPKDLKNSELCDKSTGNKYSNENYKTYSEKRLFDSKINTFKNIINKTTIEDFNLNSNNRQEKENSNKLSKTLNLSENKNYSITDFTKYLKKYGYLNTQENDLHKVNSSQDLLNKSSLSIKSTKYTPFRNCSSNFNLINNKQNINNKQITKSPIISYNCNNNISVNSIKKDNQEKKDIQNKKLSLFNNALYTNKNTQTKTYVHKKFNNNNNKLNDNNIKKSSFIKFQKKIIIINKSNRKNNNSNNNLQNIKKEEIIQKSNNNENKDLIIGNNYIKSQEAKTINTNLLNQKIVREKQINDDILNDNEKSNYNDDNENKEKVYSSPIKPDLFKNAIISDAKQKIIHDYDNDNEESNINTTDKKNLLNIIYSPSNKNPSTNKKNQTNINNNLNFQTYKIRDSTNLNFNPPNIIKTNKNSSFFVDPEKELCIGLELGNTECKVGLVNQNTSEIQLVCFEEEKYSIPTLVSFGQNKKEIKIGYEADEDILNNPSQSIFNIIKFFGEKNIDVKGKRELWPFKIYYTNNEENRPYIKINFGPQKDKIFYFENILSIFLQKLFEIIFNKVNLENSSNYNTEEKIKHGKEEDSSTNNITLNTVLVLTVPNYFTYYQRKLLENIIKTEIFPEINNENLKIYGKYKINLIGIKIENASSIGTICLNTNYDFNNNNKSNNNNILILNIDGGSTNVSITSILNENEKQIYQVKTINSIPKGENDLIDDFITYVLQKFNENIKKEILDSPLALAKLRKLCKKLRYNLIQKEKDKFNIVEILENYDEKIEISKNEYENCTMNFFNNIKTLINETLNEIKIKEKDINDIIFIGELCREKNITQIIEQLFRRVNTLYEELIYSNYMDNEKDFYILGGAAYQVLNYINK